MVYTMLDEAQVKELFREALEEMLVERRELFYELVSEVIEDLALINAIKEGEQSEAVSREELRFEAI